MTSQFPSINRPQARRQLELLGFQPGENIYLRFFYPSDDPRKDEDKGRKADRLQWKEIEAYQRQGRGVYFVVNGDGHTDSQVTGGRAIFYEHDNLDKSLQQNLWQHLGLPEPTFQVDTGGKSIHSYWVFDQPMPIQQWRELQSDLLEFADGDRSIKNPSRVMRLAGAWHISIDENGHPVYVQSRIISESGKTYTHEDLRVIPLAQCKRREPNLLEHKAKPSISGNLPGHPNLIEIPVAKAIPLEVCLAKESRSLLQAGAGEGGRNSGGAKLARDLIGTANYLNSIGQPYEGDPRQLLDDYGGRCTPPLPVKEVESIWKSAQQSNPSPSCRSEGVETCIRGWYWREWVQTARKQSFYQSDHEVSLDRGNRLNNAPSLPQQIQDILKRYETESLRSVALMELAESVGRPYRDIEGLARIVQREGQLDEDVMEAIAPLQTNLRQYRQRLGLTRHLHPSLASLLLAAAQAMPTAPEYLFTTLLSASASRIGTAARIIVNPAGGYKQPCIFWTANVSHSGQAKTPPQQVVIQPLEEMEAEASENYEEDLKDYKQDNSGEASSPLRQRFLLNNVTTQTKIRIHHENQRGLLEYLDELVSDYTRLNQFKSGKGDDLQLELGFYNGSATNYDRADARLFLSRTAFSKTGTYQWDTLSRLMQDETNFIASGYSARFLYCSIVDAPVRHLDLFKSTDAVNQLQTKLRWLYEELSNLPEADYLLSREAKVLFQAWNHTLIDAEIEEKHFGVSIIYSKIESYTARIALWLHIVNALLSGNKPAPVISQATMQSAIEIATFYLGQQKLIHAHNSPERRLEGIFLKIQTQADKFVTRAGKGVSASFLKTRINALKKWSVEKIRQLWQKLVAAGHGRIEGEGAQSVYYPYTDVGDVGEELVESPIASSLANKGSQNSVGEIGEFNQSAVSELMTDCPSHQFTNSDSSTQDSETSSDVGEPHQPDHQSPIEKENSDPTIEELQSLLLACQTLAQLKDFKQKYPQGRKQVYGSLSPEQRQQVEAVAAQAVPHDVYKYFGNQIEQDGQKLKPGALVFIDPNAKLNHSVGHVPVWLLRSLELGWQQAIAVSRDCLELVKAAAESANLPETNELPGLEGV